MDGDGSGPRFAVIAACLVVSFISSGSETAFFSISAVRMRQLLEAKRKHIEKIIELKERPDLLLGTVLFTNTVVNIIATSAVSALFPSTEIGQMVASLAATVLLLVFGEVTPKSLAAHDPEQFAFSTAVIMRYTVKALGPLVKAMNALNPAQRQDQQAQSVDEARERILVAASIGEESGELEADERQIIKQILTIDNLPASQFMHPWEQAILCQTHTTIAEAVQISQRSGYSRFPVMEQGRPAGLLLIQDLIQPLRQGKREEAIRAYLRPIARYYEAKPIGSLLQEMRQQAEQLVLISSPEGRISGFLSIEDLIEQFIGEISDEFDPFLLSEGGDQG